MAIVLNSIAVQVVSVFVVVGAAFLPVGYVCLSASKSVFFPSLRSTVKHFASLIDVWQTIGADGTKELSRC